MENNVPRIPPVRSDDVDQDQEAALKAFGDGPYPNIVMTFAQTPAALAAYAPWCLHIARGHDELPPRHREILIIRTGALCDCAYELSHHIPAGLKAGLTRDEVDRLVSGKSGQWDAVETLLVAACEELVSDHFISDATWAGLSQHLSDTALMYVVYTIAQYVQISTLLNSFGVQAETDD